MYVSGQMRPGQNEIMKDAVNTQAAYGNEYGATSGMLLPADAEKFAVEPIEDFPLYGKLKKTMTDRESGSLDTLGVTRRNIRKKNENYNNISGHEVKPRFITAGYQCVDTTLGTEITERFFRQNKERENFESIFLSEIGKEIKVDLLDLAFNGDEAVTITDADTEFVSINDGYIKQLKLKMPKKQLVNGTLINNGFFSDDVFFMLRKAVPSRLINANYAWICSEITQLNFIEYLKNRQSAVGDAVLLGMPGATASKPLGYEFYKVPNMPDDIIIFTDPKNLELVIWDDIRFRMTREGKELVSKDNRFYAWFMSQDFVVRNSEAAAMAVNVGGYNGPMAVLVANMDAVPYVPQPAQPVAVPPQVANVLPSEGTIAVALDAAITVTYDKEIAVADATKIKLWDMTAKTPKEVAATAATSGKDLTVTPSAALSMNKWYKVVVMPGAVADAADAANITKRAEVSTFETIGNDNPQTQNTFENK